VALGFQVVGGPPIENRLRQIEAGVEDVERADDRGNAGRERKSERRDVDELTGFGDPAAHIREQVAQRLPAGALRLHRGVFGQ
jgi:hypothetical protein